MSEASWNTQGLRAKAGIEPLHFLLGEWCGAGVCHGVRVTGVLTGVALLDGSWLQVTEVLLDESGAVVHEDLSLYRFDVESDALQAVQIFERGSMLSSLVELCDDGFRWITGPGAPQLRFTICGPEVSYTVHLPDEDAPVVQMSYKPA